jgi:hypothetical protein
MFDLTWTRRVTPAGLSICALRGLARRISGSGFTSWVTPQKKDYRCGQAERYLAGEHAVSVNDQVMLAAWGTPKATDGAGGRTAQTEGGGNIHLDVQARLAGWTTPTGTERSGQGERNKSFSLDATLAGWPTPAANEYEQTDMDALMERRARLQTAHGNGNGFGMTLGNMAHLAQLADSGGMPVGFLLGPSGWETVPASGQLDPAHSRWLMGLPEIFDQCAIAASRSGKKSRRESSDSEDTAMQSARRSPRRSSARTCK